MVARSLGCRPVILTAVISACAGSPGPRQLHPVAGDEFSLRSPEPPPPAVADPRCPGPGEHRFACFMADLRPRLDRAGASAAVAVAHDGAIHVATHAPPGHALPSPGARFALASLTKTIVAAAAMTLVDAGQLELHRPVSAYLPELAGQPAGTATVHQLLTHTGGLPDLGEAAACEPGSGLASLAQRLAGRPLLVAPGTVYNYSNSGYALLGAVLERVSGQPFEQMIRARVLAPLGMTTAVFTPDAPGAVHVAPTGAGPLHRGCPVYAPAGGIWASAPDMLRVLQMLLSDGGELLRPQSVAAMARAHAPVGTGPSDAYGYGMGTTSYRGLTLLDHHGRSPQFAGTWALVPERRFGVVVLVNAPVVPVATALRAARVFLDLDGGAETTRPHRPESEWTRYVGSYRDGVGALGSIVVTLIDGRLWLRFEEREPSIGLPSAVTFQPAEGPRASYLVTPWGVAVRVSPTP
jgi:CubicO group peptidase (beta-lactamase class C family)